MLKVSVARLPCPAPVTTCSPDPSRYVKRKARQDFRAHVDETDPAAADALWAQAKAELKVWQRQATVYSLYARPQKSVMVPPSHVLRWPGRSFAASFRSRPLPLGHIRSACARGAQDIPLKEALDSQAASPLPQTM